MATPFVILTTPRTGSTVLTRTLDQHSDIFCAGELFHISKNIYHPEWHFPFKMQFLQRKLSRKLFKFLNKGNLRNNAAKHIEKFYKAGNEKARGFKLMMAHIKDLPELQDYLQEIGVNVILLIRKNVFKAALSNFRAEKTGVFHSNKDVKMEKVSIDANAFAERVAALENINNVLLERTEGMKRLVVYYEDYKDWDGLMHKVFDFLQVPYQPLKPVLSKISSGNWKDEISNADEVEKVMKEQGFEQYL